MKKKSIRRWELANHTLHLVIVTVSLSFISCKEQPSTPDYWDKSSEDVIKELRSEVDEDEAVDEALGGKTLRGTPVYPRSPEDFPAEPRDLFYLMDQVAHADGEIKPLDFDANGNGQVEDVSEGAMAQRERDAVRGRNTWLLWGAGNEAFWGWLQEQGYGLEDFLVLMDSKARSSRFRDKGIINQPGFVTAGEDDKLFELLGLRIDQATPEALLLPPQDPAAGQGARSLVQTHDAQGRPLPEPVSVPTPTGTYRDANNDYDFSDWNRLLFEPGDKDLARQVIEALPKDGVDYSVYGFPSGIFGLRLVLNPDFFGNTKAAAEARKYWQRQVTANRNLSDGENYYGNRKIQMDPHLIRPFRPSMSCGFCHIGAHPLLPPLDPENPRWENLSSIIGSQHWKPQRNFANSVDGKNFLYHFLNSQPPGTIDTSLVSTDHLNNTNVINAIYDVPSRIERSLTKPPEKQAGANLLFYGRSADESPLEAPCPMVLFPGEDSVGTEPALARVYLNIGMFSEQWEKVDNPVIGFKPQRPFSVATSRRNSVYWMTNEKYRVPYLARFFLLGGPDGEGNPSPVPKSTAAMKLADALKHHETTGKSLAEQAPWQEENTRLEKWKSTQATGNVSAGREVFLNNCALCHSSKQPPGFHLEFTPNWADKPAPEEGKEPTYHLPSSFADWEAFRRSPAMADYQRRIHALAGDAPAEGPDPFLENNFLSNELRIPVTLVGTNAARALATNATRGSVWADYSSETFKELPSVGEIRYFNIAKKEAPDSYGNNDSFSPPAGGGGPGYYRPPSLISLWATAPYFHNNALGIYNHDPSISGRLAAFEDGIDRLLNQSERARSYQAEYELDPKGFRFGDLRRAGAGSLAAKDPGMIYRTPQATHFTFAAPFIPQLVRGVTSPFVHKLLSLIIWIVLFVLFLWGARAGRARHLGILLTVLGLVGAVAGLLLGIVGWVTVLFFLLLAGAGVWLLLTGRDLGKPVRYTFLGLALASLVLGTLANRFLNGKGSDLEIGPIPKGTPVSLLMNMDPEKKDKLPAAVLGLVRAMAATEDDMSDEEAWRIFQEKAAPALIEASKCPDFVLDRGHWFGEELTDGEKEDLKAFLRTL
ncbi:CvpA family protein [Roseibacillus ishigakijimensis]|uniref:US12 family protein n=1 Tax=Roseibacillus ishigakijimensis TaxID=454146 RepID=A0A934RKM4_9BACT|nr:CvpA family protein [Roseibacillus ishigakijimensis]MBK1833159.1 US12 family protein [Roseibacillus ishigakijimensis]